MIHSRHIDAYIDGYMDNDLSRSCRARVESHLQTCDRCRVLLESAKTNLDGIHHLPRAMAPPTDLWPAVQSRRKDRGHGKVETKVGIWRSTRLWVWGLRLAASVAVIAIGVTIFLIFTGRQEPVWHVTALEGNPRVGNSRVGVKAGLQIGDWIETDAKSRARIGIDSIGQIDVGVATAIQFVEASPTRRLFALKVGEIHAKVDAPPRLFVVTTPNVRAVDLGCDYSLQIDSTGAGVLRVYYGWVSLEYGGMKSIVPAGALCMTRPGASPGTPFSDDASDSLREALSRYDFEGGGDSALKTVLHLAGTADGITMWHLLFRVNPDERGRIYDRLSQLIPPPRAVTRAGFLAGDTSMTRAWQERLDIYSDETWRFSDWSP